MPKHQSSDFLPGMMHLSLCSLHRLCRSSVVFVQLSSASFSLSHKGGISGVQTALTGAKWIGANYFAVLLHPPQKIFAPPVSLVTFAQVFSSPPLCPSFDDTTALSRGKVPLPGPSSQKKFCGPRQAAVRRTRYRR